MSDDGATRRKEHEDEDVAKDISGSLLIPKPGHSNAKHEEASGEAVVRSSPLSLFPWCRRLIVRLWLIGRIKSHIRGVEFRRSLD